MTCANPKRRIKTMPTTDTLTPTAIEGQTCEGLAPRICSPLRRLVPGRGWRRPYAQSQHVWEDKNGNRVIVHSSINGITYRTNTGKSGFLYDHQEPLISALRRNASRKRAGLAAARVLMANVKNQAREPSVPNTTQTP